MLWITKLDIIDSQFVSLRVDGYFIFNFCWIFEIKKLIQVDIIELILEILSNLAVCYFVLIIYNMFVLKLPIRNRFLSD